MLEYKYKKVLPEIYINNTWIHACL